MGIGKNNFHNAFSVFCFITINPVATVSYGWALQARTHIAGPIVMQCITYETSMAIFAVFGGLLTYLNPDRNVTV